jgi:hypothetical protein
VYLKTASKWLTILVLVVVTLSVFVLSSSQASLQQPLSEKTQDLFLLLQNANASISSIFQKLEANGETIPQASQYEYNQALVLADESEILLKAGKYSEANSKIIQALQKLKETLRIIDEVIPWQQTEAELNLEWVVQLRSSMNRYYEQLERIENLTRFAASVGYNTTNLENMIQTISNLLETASNNIEQKQFEMASENLDEAKAIGIKTINAISNFADNLKIQRIATYIDKTHDRLDAIRKTAEAVSNEASLIAVDNAEASLETAEDYLEEERLNETFSELAKSKVSEDEAVEHLKPSVSSTNDTANNVSSVSP